MAPRTTYSAAMHAAVVDAVRRIGFIEAACDLVQVPRSTVYNWMGRGRDGVQPYDQFLADMMSARAHKLMDLQEAAQSDKGGPVHLLTKMFQAQHGERKSVAAAMEVLLDVIVPRLSPPSAAELLTVLDEYRRERSGAGEPGVADGQADRAGPAVIDVDGESVQSVLPASTKPHS